MKGSSSRILLVEDDDALREALADTLMLGGYDYLEAASAEAALKLLEQESVSMVVSDVNMPGLLTMPCFGHCAASIRNCRCC